MRQGGGVEGIGQPQQSGRGGQMIVQVGGGRNIVRGLDHHELRRDQPTDRGQKFAETTLPCRRVGRGTVQDPSQGAACFGRIGRGGQGTCHIIGVLSYQQGGGARHAEAEVQHAMGTPRGGVVVQLVGYRLLGGEYMGRQLVQYTADQAGQPPVILGKGVGVVRDGGGIHGGGKQKNGWHEGDLLGQAAGACPQNGGDLPHEGMQIVLGSVEAAPIPHCGKHRFAKCIAESPDHVGFGQLQHGKDGVGGKGDQIAGFAAVGVLSVFQGHDLFPDELTAAAAESHVAQSGAGGQTAAGGGELMLQRLQNGAAAFGADVHGLGRLPGHPIGIDGVHTYLGKFTLDFILVIAALVQMLELLLKKFSPALHKGLGVYLPLITTNCAVLGVAINNITDGYNFLESMVSSLGVGLGFLLAMVLFSGLRSRIDETNIPKPFRGLAVTLIAASFISLAFMGFAGIVDALFA